MPNKCIWFVEPIGESNESIAREVFGGESDYSCPICSDRRRHRLWECDEELLAAAKKARETKGFVFNIWKRERNDGICRHQEKPSKIVRGKNLVKKLAREAQKRAARMPRVA